MRGNVKGSENSVMVQGLKKGDTFEYFRDGKTYEVTVVKRRLPSKYSAVLRVTGIGEGETILSLSRTVWVEKI